MGNVLNWVQAHWGLIVGTLVVLINEAIAWSPNLKSNSLIQFLLRLQPTQNQSSLTQLK